MTQVIMPKMGDGMEEGTLLEWLKKEGDKVKSGEPIAMIQTDKASLEMEAPASGVLAGFLIGVGETVPVGVPIAALLKEGEALPTDWSKGQAAPSAEPTAAASEAPAPAAPAPPVQPEPAMAATAPAPVSVGTPSAGEGRVKASPLARKVAAELGVELAAVAGSGPGGRIVEKDVRTAQPGTAAPTSKPAPAAVAASSEDRRVPLNKIRQITAKRTAESKSTVPHFYVTVEVDLEPILALRKLYEADGDFKPSINDFILRATALALREMPGVNATYQGDHVLEYGAVNIGMAVALDDGLTVAVLHNTDRMSLREISQASKDLAGRARENRLTMDELSGSTFSISNMGMLNVADFSAIINQPNAGILAIASARKVVVPTDNDEDLEVRTKMNVTASFDHRVVDGAVGARFANAVREFLEKPTRLL